MNVQACVLAAGLILASGSAMAAPVAATGAPTELTAAQLMDQLGLEESNTAARDLPGWHKPNAMVVVVDSPERLDWFRASLPADVTLWPAKDADDSVIVADAHKDTVSAVVGVGCRPDLIAATPNLHWLQAPFAGIEACARIPQVRDGSYLITNMQGVPSPRIAEHVIAMMFYFARGLDHYAALQRAEQWDRMAVPPSQMWAVSSKTMLVVGLGTIGINTARLAHGLGMRVIATRNSKREGPEFVDYVGLSDELPELLAQADVVVNALPSTAQTRHLFNAAMFARMKRSALFINVGRGNTVVTDDLVAALNDGTIAGAGLDVQDPEPVPPGHPLWSAPNLLITPHSSGFSDVGQSAYWDVLRENMRRYVAGDKMLSVVDLKRGY
ncbi:MAG: D-2-hydroxyacid dehydrogenase [Rhodobacteraceae bacterium]|nr:D-2-hydroxyacid dehydrogenase [Paracoccaceae bacterium]